jgi:hypothetical protein
VGLVLFNIEQPLPYILGGMESLQMFEVLDHHIVFAIASEF